MAKNIETATNAINKWFYFSMNYPVKYHNKLNTDLGDVENIVLPTFITEIKWGCGLKHMIEKWQYVEDKWSASARMNEFYMGLDCGNRKRLLEWVMDNYNDECKL